MAFASTGKAPGVYIDEIQLPGPIAGAPTSTTAIVGPAQMGPLWTPTPLTNFQEFTQQFGGYLDNVFATYAVNGFFAEGGGLCYFVRVGTGVQASLTLNDRKSKPTLVVTALSEGTGGNNITVTVTAANIASPTAYKFQAKLVSATGLSASLANADAAKFSPGDPVTLEQTGPPALADNATIASIALGQKATITLTAALTKTYTGGTVSKGAGPKINVLSASGTSIVIAAGDASNFANGDALTITQNANTENPTIASIAVDNATVTFSANLTNTYNNTADIRMADLLAGQTRIRVSSTTGIEPGTYVTISQSTTGGTVSEDGVVRTVDAINSAITLTNGLQNTYSLAAAGKDITIVSQEFNLSINWPNKTGTENFNNLAMDPRHSRFFGKIVDSAAVAVEMADPPSTTPPAGNLPVAGGGAANLLNGATDNPANITTADYHKGIDTLLRVDEIALLAVPDAANFKAAADTQDIQSYMLAHCNNVVNRFAILDPRYEDPTQPFNSANIVAQRNTLSSDRGLGSLYYPWIYISNPLGSGEVLVPPSGHIAGVYADNDNTRGVFKAPANEQIASALDLAHILTDDEQGPLNDQGINIIRSFPSQGIRIWGARTVAAPDITQWRYNSIRRFVNFVEGSLRDGTRFAVFEPNNPSLWGQVKRIVTAFLTTQWQAGALEGTSPDQGFTVQVDATLNTQQTMALGQLIIQVQLNTVPPAEYVVFQIIQTPAGSSVSE